MISIHALREESDLIGKRKRHTIIISIHALREESDNLGGVALPLNPHFNPRSPRGERPSSIMTRPLRVSFQSTLSARRATFSVYFCFAAAIISIHALREESDLLICRVVRFTQNFNPRSPRGERLSSWRALAAERRVISIHALREESDVPAQHTLFIWQISIHALREESDV